MSSAYAGNLPFTRVILAHSCGSNWQLKLVNFRKFYRCPWDFNVGYPHFYTGMDKTCVYTSFYGFICVSGRRLRPGGTDCVQVRYRHIRQAAIPARVVLGTAVFCHQSNQYLVYEFPFCAMHMRVSSVSLPYLQNRCVHQLPTV